MISPVDSFHTPVKGSTTPTGTSCQKCGDHLQDDEFALAFYVETEEDRIVFYNHVDCLMESCLQVDSMTRDFLELKQELEAA